MFHLSKYINFQNNFSAEKATLIHEVSLHDIKHLCLVCCVRTMFIEPISSENINSHWYFTHILT